MNKWMFTNTEESLLWFLKRSGWKCRCEWHSATFIHAISMDFI